MLCPLRIGRKPYDGGEECAGEECMWYGTVCADGDQYPEYVVSDRWKADDAEDAQDTREKLEADCTKTWRTVANIVRQGAYPSEYWTNAEFFKLLDRQADITAREWESELDQLHMGYRPILDGLRSEVDRLKEYVSRLEADNADLKIQVNALRGYDGIEAAERWEQAFEDETAKRINAEEEAAYWKEQVRKCLDSATSHHRTCGKCYNEHVMEYPRPEGFVEPSLLVSSEVDHLLDFYADAMRKIERLEGEVVDGDKGLA